MLNFFGRNKELKSIYEILDKNEQQNILIYGRRRIGKSFLVRKALEKYDSKKIIYQCKNISEESTAEQLTKITREVFNNKYLSFSNLEDLFDFLFSQNDLILFLDEYSFLRERVEGLDSIIQQKIDEYKFSSNMKLILSGSAIDLMKNLIDYNNPLYGRFNLAINLKEHNYLESSLYYPSFKNEEKVWLYSLFGGEPYYNSLIDSSKSVKENIIDLAIKENSALEINIIGSIKNEISKISCANEVLNAIAIGKKKNLDIASAAHVDSATMNNALKRLISLDIIEKIKPINASSERKSLYVIKSNPIRFYYKYIYMNIEKRDSLGPENFFDTCVLEDFKKQFVPNVYENIAKQYLILRNRLGLNTPSFLEIGTYYYDDPKNKKNGQFDVVTLDKNGYIFYEVKFTKELIGESVLHEEMNQLKNLNINYYKLGFISKNGSNLDKGKYILYDLNDLYNLKID